MHWDNGFDESARDRALTHGATVAAAQEKCHSCNYRENSSESV
jgi:hypothetical protein